jgi:surfeit locus 1 family protein
MSVSKSPSPSLADPSQAASGGTIAQAVLPATDDPAMDAAIGPLVAGQLAARRFRPELIPTLVLVAVLALTLSAARWQLARAAYKVELQQRIEAAAHAPALDALAAAAREPGTLIWQPVTATGRFDPARTVFLDNRLRDGVAGYEVLTPLRLSGSGQFLLVNRGWIAAPAQRDRLPGVQTPDGEVRLTGLAVVPSARFMELRAGTDEPARWQNWTIERARSRWNLELLGYALQLERPALAIDAAAGAAGAAGALDDGLARQWPRPDVGIDKHRGYALQWFSFALIALVVWVVLSIRRVPPTGAGNVA